MEPILKIEALKKYYGRQPNKTTALDGIPGNARRVFGHYGQQRLRQIYAVKLHRYRNPARQWKNPAQRHTARVAARRAAGRIPRV